MKTKLAVIAVVVVLAIGIIGGLTFQQQKAKQTPVMFFVNGQDYIACSAIQVTGSPKDGYQLSFKIGDGTLMSISSSKLDSMEVPNAPSCKAAR